MLLTYVYMWSVTVDEVMKTNLFDFQWENMFELNLVIDDMEREEREK